MIKILTRAAVLAISAGGLGLTAIAPANAQTVTQYACFVFDMVWDGSELDRNPFRVGDDGKTDDADVYYDYNLDGNIESDEVFWDCPPYRP